MVGGVAAALLAQLINAGVATRTIGELLALLIEERSDRGFVAHIAESEAAEVQLVLLLGGDRGLLGLGDDLLDERTQGFCLGQRGLDSAVLDERGREIGQHGGAVFPRDAERGMMLIMTHGWVGLFGPRSATRSQRWAAAGGARAGK